MKTATVFLLLASTALAVPAQTITIGATDGFKSHYVVSPANGDPTARTDDEINTLNLRLAASGNTEADFELGLAYMQGFGVVQDLAKAEHYFGIGAIKPADKELVSGFYLEHGWFPYSPEKAVGWLLAAGRPFDLFEAAQAYRKFNPPQDAKATSIYRALLNNPKTPEYRRAQTELGNLVLDGKYSAGSKPAALYLAKWYSGEGGGTIDAGQSLTWQLIGHEGPTTVIPPPNLSKPEKLAAMKAYTTWLDAHPGWVTVPAAP
ncbi:MAG: hypothetical protein ABR971_05730 [Acidobacteriaceae bacterium]|jgi:hypothetical protein